MLENGVFFLGNQKMDFVKRTFKTGNTLNPFSRST